MQAIVCTKVGNPIEDSDEGPLKYDPSYKRPMIKPGCVRISVKTTSLNFADALIIRGLYQEKPQLPFIPGAEVFGTIIEVDSEATEFKLGDKVIALTLLGGLGQECVVHKNKIFKVPEFSDVSLSGLPIAYGTSHLSLIHKAKIKSGEKVLILGAAGGVGLAAVQICKIVGCQVVALARGQAKTDILKSLNVDIVINTEVWNDNKELSKHILKLTGGGVDVVLDPVGGEMFRMALNSIKWNARILLIGFASGEIQKIPANILLVKNITVHGVHWGNYFTQDIDTVRNSMKQVIQWVEEKKLQVLVSHQYNMRDINKAFKTLLTRKAIGKIIIIIDNSKL